MKNTSILLIIPSLLLLGATYLGGLTLKETVEHTLLTNEEIQASLNNNEAYKFYIDEAKTSYYPKLDLSTFIEKKNTKLNPVGGNNSSSSTDGFNIQLDFEQLIYDGKESSSNIKIAKYTYLSNKYLSISIIDTVLLNSIRAYLNVNKYKDKILVDKESLSVYDTYLITAIDTEEISGEALHHFQVSAKIHYAKNKLYENTSSKFVSNSSFLRHVGMDPSGEMCRPFQDKKNFPITLGDYLKKVLSSNALILSQIEKINRRVSLIQKSKSSSFPLIKFKVAALYDNELITNKEDTQIYSARIELVYNLFDGGKDKSVTNREKAFLLEEQKTLDTVSKKAIDDAMVAYHTYYYSEKRITELNLYINSNKKILLSYRDEFDGGTKTFIDVLNVERDLFSAKNELLDVAFINDFSYFEVFNHYSYLKEAILQSDIDCKIIVKEDVKEIIKEELLEESELNLLEESGLDLSEELPLLKKELYTLFLDSYLKESNAKEHLLKIKALENEDVKVRIIKVSGLYDLSIYDVLSEVNVIELKNKYIKEYPSLYYGQYISK